MHGAHRLVYTRKTDGGINVFCPTKEAVRVMTSGGGYWDDKPRGFLDELVRRKTCPKLQKGANVTRDAAWKFIKAMQWGGLTTAETWPVFAAHDCERFGHDIQLLRYDELPDRWFREAWTRERSNSGVPYIDLEKARSIQWQRLLHAVSRENKRREYDLFGPPPIRISKPEYATAIKHARDAEELKKIWAPSLPR